MRGGERPFFQANSVWRFLHGTTSLHCRSDMGGEFFLWKNEREAGLGRRDVRCIV